MWLQPIGCGGRGKCLFVRNNVCEIFASFESSPPVEAVNAPTLHDGCHRGVLLDLIEPCAEDKAFKVGNKPINESGKLATVYPP